MIKLTIFGFLLVCAMSALFPDYDWLTIPIFVAVALIWLAAKILRSLSGPNPPENRKDPRDFYDEFDWWQDNQGL